LLRVGKVSGGPAPLLDRIGDTDAVVFAASRGDDLVRDPFGLLR